MVKQPLPLCFTGCSQSSAINADSFQLYVITLIDRELPATHTTPDPVQLNRILAEMVRAGCDYAFMEVSSHAVDQKRIAGLKFAGGIFTNLTHDHLDYHKTFDNYLTAKKSFFDSLSPDAFALANIDDRNGKVMLQNCNARKYTFSARGIADFRCNVIEQDLREWILKFRAKRYGQGS